VYCVSMTMAKYSVYIGFAWAWRTLLDHDRDSRQGCHGPGVREGNFGLHQTRMKTFEHTSARKYLLSRWSFIHPPCFAQAKGLLDAAFLGLLLSLLATGPCTTSMPRVRVHPAAFIVFFFFALRPVWPTPTQPHNTMRRTLYNELRSLFAFLLFASSLLSSFVGFHFHLCFTQKRKLNASGTRGGWRRRRERLDTNTTLTFMWDTYDKGVHSSLRGAGSQGQEH